MDLSELLEHGRKFLVGDLNHLGHRVQVDFPGKLLLLWVKCASLLFSVPLAACTTPPPMPVCVHM